MRSALVPLALLTACQSATLVATNASPTAVIVSPGSGATLTAGRPALLRGVAGDRDSDPSELLATWWVDEAVVCDGVVPGSDGGTQCEAALTAGTRRVRLEVRDPERASAIAEVTVDVRADLPPTAKLLAPVEGARAAAGEAIELLATVSDPEDPPSALGVRFLSDRDGELTLEGPPDAGGQVRGRASLSVGAHTVAVEVTDPFGHVRRDEAEIVVLPPESAPSCALLAPAAGRWVPGDAVRFEVEASDDATPAPDLTVVWTSDLQGELARTQLDASGRGAYTTAALVRGAHQVSVRVTDADGLLCVDAVGVEIDGPPSLQLTAPAAGSVWAPPAPVGVAGIVNDAEELATALVLTWSSDVDGYLGGLSAAADGTFSGAAALSTGVHRLVVTATDRMGSRTEASAEVRVNAPPGPPGVVILPDAPRTDDRLVAAVDRDAVDAEGDALTLRFQWRREDGLLIDGAEVDPALTTRGERWTLTGWAADAWAEGAPGSASRVIGNTPPVVDSAEITPRSPTIADTLTCAEVGARDADGDAVSVDVAWEVDGVEVGRGATLPAGAAGQGAAVRCAVTPDDGVDLGAPVWSPAVIVGNGAPSITGVVIEPDPPRAVDTIRCAAVGFVDPDGGPDQTRLRWTVDGADAGEGALLVAPVARGQRVICEATPSDGLTDGAPMAAVTVVVNTPPTATAAVISPALPLPGEPLGCAVEGYIDADGDADGTVYRWTIDGVFAGEGPVLGALTVAGDVVRCEAEVRDGLEVGAVLVDELRVANTPPEIGGAEILPSTPSTLDPLRCALTGVRDADGDGVDVAYRWWIDGAVVGADAELPPGVAVRGDEVVCEATPDDGTQPGPTVRSAPVSMGNAPPEIADAVITPSAPSRVDSPRCQTVGWLDADGDADQSRLVWTVDGAPAGAGPGLLAPLTRGQVLTCVATPFDGRDEGAQRVATAVVSNAAPDGLAAVITPSAPAPGDLVTCALLGFDDPDGDADQSRIVWTVDGAPAGVGPALARPVARGAEIGCVITVSDGLDDGPVLTDAVTAVGAAPSVAAARVVPGDPRVTDALVCEASGVFDPDGDPVSLAYAWWIDGARADGGEVLAAGAVARGAAVACEVTPSDEEYVGLTVRSPAVVVGNSAPSLDAVWLEPSPVTRADVVRCALGAVADADGDRVEVRREWRVDGAAAGEGEVLPAAVSRGQVVSCTATPGDGIEDGPARTATEVVENAPPDALSISLGPAPARVGDALVCAVLGFSDVDGDPDRTTYAWTIDGAPAGAGGTLTAPWARGQVVTCEATVTDGIDAGPTLSASVIVENTPPTLLSAEITPSDPTSSDRLRCEVRGGSDADGDRVTVAVRWEIDGVVVGAGDTLDGAPRGSTVRCVATPSDGLADGAPVVSAPVVPGNSAPEAAGVSLTPQPLYADGRARCAAVGFTDADGDPDLSRIRWEVDGVNVGEGLVQPVAAARGSTVRCELTPFDGLDAGAPWAASVVVSNRAPTAAAAVISPEVPDRTSAMRCDLVGYTDPDGDPSQSTWRWLRDGQLLGTAPALSAAVQRGDTLRCEIALSDGVDVGAVLVDEVTVGNATPEVLSAALSPVPLHAGDVVHGSATFADADGDAVTGLWTWFINGSQVATGGADLVGGGFVRGDLVAAEVRPTDGLSVGAPRTVGPVVVENTAPGAPVVAIVPSSPIAYDALRCVVVAGAVDADGGAVSYAAAWTGPAGVYPGATTSFPGDTVPAGVASAGVWTCTVTPVDDAGASGPTGSAAVEVALPWGDPVVSLQLADVQIYGESLSDHLGEGSCPLATPDIDGDGIDDLVLGVPELNVGPDNDVGSVNVFFGASLQAASVRPLSSADRRVLGDRALGNVGACVIDAGDLDGDGLDELLVAGPMYGDAAARNVGRVWLFRGSDILAGATSVASAWRVWDGLADGDFAGRGLAGGLDLDGGGVPDLVIGAPQTRAAGKAYVLRGESLPASGPLTSAWWTISGSQSADRAGETVGVGDLDGDGGPELVVGAPGARGATLRSGLVWALKPTQLPVAGGNFPIASSRWRVVGPRTGDALGERLVVHDLDGDGLDDMIVGAPNMDVVATDDGAVMVYEGAALPVSGDVVSAQLRVTGAAAGDGAGFSVAVVPDVTLDDRPELLIGAPYRDLPATSTGDVGLLISQGLPFATERGFASADVVFRGEDFNDRAGWAAFGGDVNGDGLGDVIVAAPFESAFASTAGRVYVYFGE